MNFVREIKPEALTKNLLMTVLNSRHGDRSYRGDILKVVHVEVPFVVVSVYRKHQNKLGFDYKTKLDTREFIFGEISREYINSLCSLETELEIDTKEAN